jgi:hypothetical protein
MPLYNHWYEKLSLRAAAKPYDVLELTLHSGRAGIPARGDTIPKSRRLKDLEEKAIVQYISDLSTRSFPPRLYSVEDIANQLLCAPNQTPIVCAQSLLRVHKADTDSSLSCTQLPRLLHRLY